MGLFKRKIEKPLNENQEQAAGRIANALLRAQQRSAEWLNARALKIGRNKIILILSVLGLGFGLWCLWLVVGVQF